MAARKKRKPKALPTPPRIHEAELAFGASGAVLKGAEIDLVAAIARRQAGLDIVVCGSSERANRNLARQIESALGPVKHQKAPTEAGPAALPHFQPQTRPPTGHTFYETGRRQQQARKPS